MERRKRLAFVALLLVLAPAFGTEAAAPERVDCTYVPRESRGEPFPEITPHADCGAIVDDRLLLDVDHRERLGFEANGLAWVLTREGVFYVDRSGRSVRTHWIDFGPDPFVDGLARGITRGKYGFVDDTLRFVIEPRFDFAFPFGSDGFAVVCNGCRSRRDGEYSVQEGGLWGVIDQRGTVVVPLEHAKEDLRSSPAFRRLGP